MILAIKATVTIIENIIAPGVISFKRFLQSSTFLSLFFFISSLKVSKISLVVPVPISALINANSSSSNTESSSGDEGGLGEAGGGSQDIANNGDTYVLLKGKRVLKLNDYAVKLFNILSLDVDVSNLVAKDFKDEDGVVKTISTETNSKSITKICEFVDGKMFP